MAAVPRTEPNDAKPPVTALSFLRAPPRGDPALLPPMSGANDHPDARVDGFDAAPAPPQAKRGRRRRSATLMFLLVAALLVFTAWLGDWGVRDFRARSASVEHSLQLQQQIERVHGLVEASDARHFAYLLDRENAIFQAFMSLRPALHNELARLEQLAQSDDLTRADTLVLVAAITRWETQQDLLLHATEQPAATSTSARLQQAQRAIASALEAMRQRQSRTLFDLTEQANHSASRMRMYAAMALLLSLGMLGGAFWSTAREQGRRARAEHELKISLADAKSLAENLRQLGEFGELLQSCRSVEEAMAICRSAAPNVLVGMGGSIYLIDETRNMLNLAGEFGRHQIMSRFEFAPEDCWAMRRNRNFCSSDAPHGACCNHLHTNKPVEELNYLCIPLTAQGQALGVLYLDASEPISRSQRRLARALAEQVSLTLANVQLQDSLRTQSIRDPLTGLFNRRYLDESVEREFGRAERRSHPVSVLMIDVDHFKRFNDNHGHDAGDAVLAQIAALLRRQSRREDIACRYGGEEFVLIMPEATTDAASARAEKLRTAIGELQIKHRGRDLERLTASIGVATFPLHGRVASEVRDAADRALYKAKHSGRNRVVCAEN